MNNKDCSKNDKYESSSDIDTDESDTNDPYTTSIRNNDGLETGISVAWPGLSKPLILSTILQPTDIAPLFHGTQWAGTRVWQAALVAVEYLLKDSGIHSKSRILELGCGLGVPGMILHALRGARVVLTDQAALVSQLESNLQSNFAIHNKDTRISACALDWSSADSISDLLNEYGKHWDIVLSCDCVYEPLYGSCQSLVQVIRALLQANPRTVVLTSVERRKADGLETFVQSLSTSDTTTVQVLSRSNIEIYKTTRTNATNPS